MLGAHGGLRVRYQVTGRISQTITVQMVRTSGAHGVTATYSSATWLTVTYPPTATVGQLRGAINGARHSGSQLLVATLYGSGSAGDVVTANGTGQHNLSHGSNQETVAREPLAASLDADARRIQVRYLPGTDTLAQVAAALDALATGDHAGLFTTTATGAGAVAANGLGAGAGATRDIALAGGSVAGPITVERDASARRVDLGYAATDTLDALIAAAAAVDGLTLALVYGTSGSAHPETPGWTRPFDWDLTGGERGEKGDPGTGTAAARATLRSWQDGQAQSAPPGTAAAVSAYVGQGLEPVTFAAQARPRHLHFEVPLAYAIDLIAVDGDNRLDGFTTTTTAAVRRYHSAALQATGAVDVLVRVVSHG